jgi:hypothetical protein
MRTRKPVELSAEDRQSAIALFAESLGLSLQELRGEVERAEAAEIDQVIAGAATAAELGELLEAAERERTRRAFKRLAA